jgi:hypothetical protein
MRPPGLVVPSLVWMSTMPEVRRPNCAGSAPVMKSICCDEAGVDRLAEAGDALRQLHAVDAVLHVGVVVAHVDRAGALGVLAHARQAQQHFVERRVVALAQLVDHVGVDRVDGGADLRRQIDARALQVGGGHFHLLHRRGAGVRGAVGGSVGRCIGGGGGGGRIGGVGRAGVVGVEGGGQQQRQRAELWNALHVKSLIGTDMASLRPVVQDGRARRGITL